MKWFKRPRQDSEFTRIPVSGPPSVDCGRSGDYVEYYGPFEFSVAFTDDGFGLDLYGNKAAYVGLSRAEVRQLYAALGYAIGGAT